MTRPQGPLSAGGNRTGFRGSFGALRFFLRPGPYTTRLLRDTYLFQEMLRAPSRPILLSQQMYVLPGKVRSVMKRADEAKQDAFGGCATYQIVVQGTIPVSWSDRLAGMAVQGEPGKNGEASRAMLVGSLRDQSELNAVLDVLYNLHLPIIRVEKVADSPV